ncbi:MAG: hypothetical protein HUU46_20555 [Candidatus Hydrogenedentes bacterium]|nr:hypothetical protein [Candidatus Hydrogenedentota bacterium]
MQDTLTLVYFPTAIVLGALHALEPGHAKTLTAAYLIGIKGTKRDALLLGLSVAATHSVVVIALAAGALYLGREAFADSAMYWLQISSGVIVVGLGAWLLWRRWPRHAPHEHGHHHHHAPDPVHVHGKLVHGTLEIIDTPEGERMRLTLDESYPDVSYRVEIQRDGNRIEVLPLCTPDGNSVLLSDAAPEEPHEFSAALIATRGDDRETVSFGMQEPIHDHDHSHMTDDEHARAHAATLPDYAKRGDRPTVVQLLSFGAAGGMIPCPASVTVMLLALSVGKAGMGMLTVLGFSFGLAVTLVGVGLTVVLGIRAVGRTHRFEWVSQSAPALSAAVVMVSGLAALVFAQFHGQ